MSVWIIGVVLVLFVIAFGIIYDKQRERAAKKRKRRRIRVPAGWVPPTIKPRLES